MNTLLAGLAFEAETLGETLTVIHGDAPGADRLADRLARQWSAEVIREPADWSRFGKGAGPVRNQKMLDEHRPERVYAFRAAGKSNGTDDMIQRAQDAGLKPYIITTPEEI